MKVCWDGTFQLLLKSFWDYSLIYIAYFISYFIVLKWQCFVLVLSTITLLIDDPDVKIKLKTQSLINPAFQILDVDIPTNKEYSHFLLLFQSGIMIHGVNILWWVDHLRKPCFPTNIYLWNQVIYWFVNWSSFLPGRFIKGHVYNNPTYGSS